MVGPYNLTADHDAGPLDDDGMNLLTAKIDSITQLAPKAGPGGGGGDEKVACRAYRAYYFDNKSLPSGLGVGFQGGTPNHYLGYSVVAYCSTPVAGKAKLLDALAYYRKYGHMSHLRADEWKSGSHPSWYYSPVIVALGVALRRNDHDVIEACVDFLRRDQGSDMDSRVPYGQYGKPKEVIIEGARMWGGGEADQRKIRDMKTALLNHEKIRDPKVIDTALDLTWLKAWRVIEKEFTDEAGDVGTGIGRDERPATRSVRHHASWKDGHQSGVKSPVHQLKPVFWCKVTYSSKKVEYGGNEDWSKFYAPAVPPPGYQEPDLPAGVGTVVLREYDHGAQPV